MCSSERVRLNRSGVYSNVRDNCTCSNSQKYHIDGTEYIASQGSRSSLLFNYGLKLGRRGLTLGSSSVSECSESVPVCGVDTAVSVSDCGSALIF